MTQLQSQAIALRAAGYRNKAIAERLNLSQPVVCNMLKGCGIPLPLIRHEKTIRIKKEVNPAIIERTRLIVNAYRAGQTLQQIGDVFGITREWVRRILCECGVSADLGGVRLRSFVRRSEKHRKANEKKAARIAKYEVYFGCCHDEIARICGNEFAAAPWSCVSKKLKSPGVSYMTQRRNAEVRGIGWELPLTEWWRIWQKSGKWEQRGRGKGYCMGRLGDSGPYSVDNVYICTIGQNFSDSYLVHPWHERFPNLANTDPDKLSTFQEEAIALRKTGLKIREVADRIGRPVGSVSCALSKGMKKLSRLEAISAEVATKGKLRADLPASIRRQKP